MNKYGFFILTIFFALGFFACNTEDDIPDDEEGQTTLPEGVEDPSDYAWNSSDETAIALKGTSATITGSGATAEGAKVKIEEPGNYRISGTLGNGQIVAKTDKEGIIRIILDGANITNTTTSPLFIDKAEKVVIVLEDGTANSLTDAASYSDIDEGQNAALYSQSYLAIFGDGTLTVKGNYKDGISGKDGLVIKSGNLHVTAIDDGIRGKDFLYIYETNITVNCGGDGMKSDNETDSSAGYITILDGTYNITSGGDGISATTSLLITGGEFTVLSGGGSSKTIAATASAKALKGLTLVSLEGTSFNLNSAEDAIHSDKAVKINGGSFTISATDDGIHSEQTILTENADINIQKSVEGVEAKFITVNSGNISVVSSDDSFNATSGTRTEQNDGSCIYINGGTVILNGSTGDPLDSNGSIDMKGGTVIIHGPKSQPEVAIDYNGTFNLSSGFLVASGASSNMLQGPSTSSAQKSLKLVFKSTLAASTLFHIQDADGKNLVTFSPARNYLTMVFSSPDLVANKTYSLYSGGSSTGTNSGGLVLDGSYSGGTLKKTFTVTSSVTTITIN